MSVLARGGGAVGGAGALRSAVRLDARRAFRGALPVVALAGIYVWIVTLQSAAASYDGLTLLLASAIPLVFAALAQMVVIVLGDIDLGIGPFVGLVNVICARYLSAKPALGVALLAALIAAYGLMGAIISLRRLPSIIATLGASFIWQGFALLVLPVPGGAVPGWLASFWGSTPPLVPLPIVIAVVGAVAAWLLVDRSRLGVLLRAAGSNLQALKRSDWSLLRIRVAAYVTAGLFGVLAGLATTALTASGDANASSGLTLVSVAAVILGGGEFSGGIVSPTGTVIGAVVVTLVGSLLSLLNVSSDYQSAVQGGILIVVLALRGILRWQR